MKKTLILIILFIVDFFSLYSTISGFEKKGRSVSTLKEIQVIKDETSSIALPPGGPTQPEVQSFTPVDANDLVNPFNGKFSYNIPLIDVGGFPVNISYDPDVKMEDEASCVGLGWSLNLGSINRIVRGLPDDFNGTDKVETQEKRKDEVETGVGLGGEIEVTGIPIKLGGNLSATYNSYNGWAAALDINLATSDKACKYGSLGLGLNASSNEGTSLKPKVKISLPFPGDGNHKLYGGFNVGYKYSTFKGTHEGSYGLDLKMKSNYIMNVKEKNEKGDYEMNMRERQIERTSGSFGGTVKSSTPFYTPYSRFPTSSVAFSFRAAFGSEIWTLFPNFSLTGFVITNSLSKEKHHQPAYGYMYEHLAKKDENFLMDVSREQDGWVNESAPQLPVSHQTYDWFDVSGHGISGQFRAFRNDYIMVGDGTIDESLKPDVSAGLEGGIGTYWRLGGDFSLSLSHSVNSIWWKKNELANSVFAPINQGSIDRTIEIQPVCFKDVTELTPMSGDDEHDLETMGNFKPILADVEIGKVKNELIIDETKEKIPANKIKRYSANKQTRNYEIPRLNVFSYLSASDAQNYGLDKSIKSYKQMNQSHAPNTWPVGQMLLDRIESNSEQLKSKKAHHISEIKVTKDDGTRYVYGIPVYNRISKDVVFNISKATLDIAPGTKLIKYSTGDNSMSNDNGLDKAYRSTTTPAYAHSFLLTAILSDDYVDVDDNGPSSNDLGSYTKINYSRIASDYKWRIPFYANHATYEEGANVMNGQNNGDDIASYSYGEKELWYIQSIETKNYLAVFYFGNRDDGYGVFDENGGINTLNVNNNQKKLECIKVFVKSDVLSRGLLAVPIKTVNFEYDYSLCQGVPYNLNYHNHYTNTRNGGTTDAWRNFINEASSANNSFGKLTLKKVYFTYANSARSAAESYVFTYQENKPYHPMGFNRWGGYDNPVPSIGELPNDEFPYISFDKSLEDRNVKAWTLHKIKMPSGAILEIDYESNDYAYIQDKKTSSMMKLKGFSERPNAEIANINNNLYSEINHDMLIGSDQTTFIKKNYLYFELPPNLSRLSTDEKMKAVREMTEELGALYFSCMLSVGQHGGTVEYLERVKSFIPLPSSANGYEWKAGEDYGLSANNEYGWINIMAGSDNSYKYHPITEAGVKFIKENIPQLAFNERPITDNVWENLEAIGVAIGNIFENMTEDLHGLLFKDGRCKWIKSSESYIRLYTPGKTKLGGGKRVKKITIHDRWGVMANKNITNNSSLNNKYTIVYKYTKTEDGKEISSGVAAFEPGLGQDENTFVLPFKLKQYQDRTIEHKKMWSIKNRSIVTPLGLGYFPAHQVGYSQVKIFVNPLNPDQPDSPDNTRSASGYTEYEFYTARDFPTVVEYTKPKVILETSDWLRSMDAPSTTVDESNAGNTILSNISNTTYDYLTISQGYSIVLNNMHGKLKGVKKYAEGVDVPIQSTQYYYRTSNDGSKVKLNNKVPCINPAGTFSDKMIGVSYDLVPDSRYFDYTSGTGGVMLNVDVVPSPALGVPVPIVSLFPIYGGNTTELRIICITKAIYMHGIIDSVVVNDMGQQLTTKNLLYDGETGDLIVSATPNEYNDLHYSTTIPARWENQNIGMQPAYKASDLIIKDLEVNANYRYSISNTAAYAAISVGDEMFAQNDDIAYRCWVSSKENGLIKLIDLNGRYINIPIKRLVMLRPAKRNLLNAEVGNIITLSNPKNEERIASGDKGLLFEKVINSSSLKYADEWQSYKVNRYSVTGQQCVCSSERQVEIKGSNRGNLLIGEILKNFFNHLIIQNKFLSDQFTFSYTDFNSVEGLPEFFLQQHLGGSSLSYEGNISSEFDINLNLNGNSIQLAMQAPFQHFCKVLRVVSLSADDSDRGLCHEKGKRFKIRLELQSCAPEQSVFVKDFIGTSDVFEFKECELTPIALDLENCGDETDFSYNPFVNNNRGNFSALHALSYDTTRIYVARAVRYQGLFPTFHSCWNAGQRIANIFNLEKWKWMAKNAKVNPYGKLIEQVDRLNVYSSSLYGYSNSFQIASAANANYEQIGYESFEDILYTNRTSADECNKHFHWIDRELIRGKIEDRESHTGQRSLKLGGSSGNSITLSNETRINSRPDNLGPYKFEARDRAGKFRPSKGTYFVSLWVKTKLTVNPSDQPNNDHYNNAKIFINGEELRNRSEIIDGWQQIFDTVQYSGIIDFSIKLEVNGSNTIAYFDDMRVQPVRATMNTYVYDMFNLRLSAVLDDNNYATFYEYDGEGELVRVKKETEKGVITLQEVDTGSARRIQESN